MDTFMKFSSKNQFVLGFRDYVTRCIILYFGNTTQNGKKTIQTKYFNRESLYPLFTSKWCSWENGWTKNYK